MAERDQRHALFVHLLDSIALSRGEIAKWMFHQDTKKTRDYVSRKYSGKSGVLASDISLLYMLKELQGIGLNVDQYFASMGSAGFLVPTGRPTEND